MTSCLICQKPVSAGSPSKDDICINCENERSATVSELKARILKLETQLNNQKTTAERLENPLKSNWAYNFSEEYLH